MTCDKLPESKAKAPMNRKRLSIAVSPARHFLSGAREACR